MQSNHLTDHARVNHYQTIVADPPWYEKGGGRIKRGADRHYPLMKTVEIVELGDFVQRIAAPDCHLYLWVTNNFLPDGFLVMKEWGFKYITMITWMKDRIGLGQYFRGLTEHCLFGRKGQPPYKVDSNGKRCQGKTGFFSPKYFHSEKPRELIRMAELVSHPPRIELFARQKRVGWDSWGLQARRDA